MKPVVATPAAEHSPRFSRDGRWLAYSSDESGRFELYVQPFPGPGPRTQVSTDGGSHPIWSADGGELFYRAGNRVMAADVKTHPVFTASMPRILFEGPYVGASGDLSFDVSPDGKRFLMIRTDPSSSLTRFNLVLNWTPESSR